MSDRRPVRPEIRPHRGLPTLHVDGSPDPAIGYLTFHPETRGRFADFAAAGIRLFAFNTTCNHHTYGTARPVAVAPGRFDFREVDRRASRILAARPDAWLLPRVYVGSPPWWDALHPRELIRYPDGSCTRRFRSGTLKSTVPSFSSEAWRRFARESLHRFVEHVLGSPYGDRVIGFQLMGGETEEWFYHGTYEGYLSDYSDPHRRAFRSWRRKHRRGFLRRGDDIPAPDRRVGDGRSVLLDPAVESDVGDYVLFRSREVADVVIELADVVKETSGGRVLCGAFYGYVLELASHPHGLQLSGHLAFDRVIRSPSIDFLSSPSSYIDRRVAKGYSAFMSMTDSVRLHGKLWFNENDSRTHRTPLQYGCFRTADTAQTSAIMKREFAHATARGSGLWWFDMRGGWYRERENLEEVARLQALAHARLRAGRRSVAQIALLVDAEGLRWLRLGNPLQAGLLGSQLQHLGRIGAPFDCFQLGDLEEVPDYRAYVVLSGFAPGRRDRRALRRVLKRDDKTVLWIYAPGVVKRGRLDPRGIEDLVEMEFATCSSEMPARVDVVPGPDPHLSRVRAPLSYGVPQAVRPVFHPDDRRATVLGHIHGTGLAGLAVRECGGWKSVFSVAPCLPAHLLRSILEPAGLSFFLDGHDAVYANEGFLGIHADGAGVRRVRLPRRHAVTDLASGREVGGDISSFAVELSGGETALFALDAPRPGAVPAPAPPVASSRGDGWKGSAAGADKEQTL